MNDEINNHIKNFGGYSFWLNQMKIMNNFE